MALSPNYGWAEPDNSSLVKNGAQDIRALGDAIDTSVWNLGYGQAGKNKIINGDFFWNQRNFTSNTTSVLFNFDRWFQSNSGGTFTVTPQSFTLGTAPVAGYESKTFLQGITASQSAASDYAWFGQKIESVRTFAGQTATISFWAKAGSGTPKMAVELQQFFGSGGSPSASVNTYAGQVTLSTSWARYSVTAAVPSISGKTLGTANDDVLRLNLMVSAGTDYNARSGSLGVQNNTFQIWGVQAEYGSKATPFQTATGTIQGELAACQRYYWRTTSQASSTDNILPLGMGISTTEVQTMGNFPVRMRTNPTAVEWAGLRTYDGTTFVTVTAITLGTSTLDGFLLSLAGASGMVQYRPTQTRSTSSSPANSYVGFSAEL
jgi:hypothetical protein